MHSKLNSPDSDFLKTKELLNLLGLASCWIAVIADVIYFAISNKSLGFIIGAMWTPCRYFFFDMSPSKLQRRPASLDRSLLLTIFVNYLSISFPMPHGDFLADIAGFLLACARAAVNGYALLIFDTFSWLYSVKNDVSGIPLNDGVDLDAKEEDEEDEEDEEAEESEENDEDKIAIGNVVVSQAQANQPVEESYAKQIKRRLNEWNFPLRRYKAKPNYYFENNEVGAAEIIKSGWQDKEKSSKNK